MNKYLPLLLMPYTVLVMGFGMWVEYEELSKPQPLTEVQNSVESWIVEESLRVGLPPEFALAQFYRESKFRTGQYSTAKRGTANVGPAQLNLGTFPAAADQGWKAQLRDAISHMHKLYLRCWGDPVCTEWAYRSGKVQINGNPPRP